MLINIQLLRFLAALVVVLHHASAHLRAGGNEAGFLFDFGRYAGFAGVDVFFVISGFIMVWTTEHAAGRSNAVQFLKRRVARIYSGYWPFYILAIGLSILTAGGQLERADMIRSAILWPTELRHLLIPVSWTLIFEMGFYILFALLIFVGRHRRLYWICGLFLASCAWFVYAQFFRQAYDPGRLEAMNIYEQYLLFPYLLEFLAGALLAYRMRHRPEGWAWPFLLAGLGMMLLGGCVNESLFHEKLIEGYYVMWRVPLFGTAAVFVVAGLVRLEARGWKAPARLSLITGGASYALYLSHTLILAGTRKSGFDAWTSHMSPTTAQAAFVCLIALITLYSVVHYRWLERPLHHVFRRILRA